MKLKKISLFCAGALLAAAAYAAPPYGYNVTYYTDETFTTVAGNGWFNCSGQWHLSNGVETGYIIESNHNQCRWGGWDLDPWG